MYSKDLPKVCAYCRHGAPMADRAHVLCRKRGVVTQDYHCRKYSYDPFKRDPRPKPSLPSFDESDFKI